MRFLTLHASLFCLCNLRIAAKGLPLKVNSRQHGSTDFRIVMRLGIVQMHANACKRKNAPIQI